MSEENPKNPKGVGHNTFGLLKGKGSFVHLREKAAAGDFSWMIEPLDWKIIETLPDEGTSVGGLYQLGTVVKDIIVKLGGALTTGQTAGRIRALEAGGLVRQVRMVSSRGKISWQKTALGKEKLIEWQTRTK